MKFTLNGKTHIHSGNGTLSALLKEISAENHQVAVMINDNIIKRNDIPDISLKDGDTIEVITYATGG